MADNDIHLVYGSDDNYYFPTSVSAASAASGVNDESVLVIHLFDLGVSDPHYAEIEGLVRKANPRAVCRRHVLDGKMFEGFGAWRGSIATYSRMFVQDLLPDLEWAIYVDGDTLWLGDIGELWKLRDPSVLIQASIDPPPPQKTANENEFSWYKENGLVLKNPSDYFCAGLILLNLKGLREFGLTAKCRAFMASYTMPRIVDQTVLNYVLQGHSKLLPPEWGIFSAWHGDADLSKSGCVHYVNDVPWRRDKLNRLLSDVVMLWFDFCKDVLGRNELCTDVSPVGRIWRRAVFVFLKYNQWLLFCPYIRSRLRNTYGIPGEKTRQIRGQWQRLQSLRKNIE